MNPMHTDLPSALLVSSFLPACHKSINFSKLSSQVLAVHGDVLCSMDMSRVTALVL